MLNNGDSLSHQRLCELAFVDAQISGRGTANAILTLPWKRLQGVYQAMHPAARNVPFMFEGNELDVTVSAIFDEITVPRYRRV